MRQAVGVERDERADADIEERRTPTHKANGGNSSHQPDASLALPRRRERVDDAPEQDRLGELRRREREIGDRQK